MPIPMRYAIQVISADMQHHSNSTLPRQVPRGFEESCDNQSFPTFCFATYTSHPQTIRDHPLRLSIESTMPATRTAPKKDYRQPKASSSTATASTSPFPKRRPVEQRNAEGIPGLSKIKSSIRQTKRLLAKVGLGACGERNMCDWQLCAKMCWVNGGGYCRLRFDEGGGGSGDGAARMIDLGDRTMADQV
jgi:hypothetical protein